MSNSLRFKTKKKIILMTILKRTWKHIFQHLVSYFTAWGNVNTTQMDVMAMEST